MADLDAVLEQLKQERKRAEAELKQLARVIAELSKVGKSRSQTSVLAQGKRRQLSSAARERIAAAQRTRWARVRAQSKKAAPPS